MKPWDIYYHTVKLLTARVECQIGGITGALIVVFPANAVTDVFDDLPVDEPPVDVHLALCAHEWGYPAALLLFEAPRAVELPAAATSPPSTGVRTRHQGYWSDLQGTWLVLAVEEEGSINLVGPLPGRLKIPEAAQVATVVNRLATIVEDNRDALVPLPKSGHMRQAQKWLITARLAAPRGVRLTREAYARWQKTHTPSDKKWLKVLCGPLPLLGSRQQALETLGYTVYAGTVPNTVKGQLHFQQIAVSATRWYAVKPANAPSR